MKYTKAAFSYTGQLELLISRKLTCNDRDRALKWLQRVGYYRLSAYFLPFRIPGTNDFQPGAALDHVLNLYKFDGGLRLLTLQALDRLEVPVRAIITYQLSHELVVFGYADPANFFPTFDHAGFLKIIAREATRSAEVFVEHYQTK